MTNTERFRRLQAHRYTKTTAIADRQAIDKHLARPVDGNLLESLNDGPLLPSFDVEVTVSREEVGDILNTLKAQFHSERIDFALDQLKAELIRSIVVPFGLGRVFAAYDKTGGNVDTLHNVANKDHEESKEIEIDVNGKSRRVKIGIYANEHEENKYVDHLRRNEYQENKDKIHKDDHYTEANAHASAQQKEGGVEDGYTGRILGPKDKKEQDHIVSAKETYDDPRRLLADIETEDLANLPDNLTQTDRTINRSKKDKTMDDFLGYLEQKKSRLEELDSKPNLTPSEERERRKLRKLADSDADRMKHLDEKARRAQDKEINWTYYTSEKFARGTLVAGAKEGTRMAFQQAIGIVIVEFLTASFEETKRAVGSVREGAEIISVVKASLIRVKDRILERWRNIFVAMGSGFLSGFLSSLLTTLLNAVVTTGKRAIRMVREGVFSFVRALEVVLFPSGGKSFSESLHEGSKVLLSGTLLIGGIALEEAVEKAVMSFSTILGILVAPLTAVIIGAFTALAVAVACYVLDKLDIFGAIQLEEDRFVLKSLDNKIVALKDEWDLMLEELIIGSTKVGGT